MSVDREKRRRSRRLKPQNAADGSTKNARCSCNSGCAVLFDQTAAFDIKIRTKYAESHNHQCRKGPSKYCSNEKNTSAALHCSNAWDHQCNGNGQTTYRLSACTSNKTESPKKIEHVKNVRAVEIVVGSAEDVPETTRDRTFNSEVTDINNLNSPSALFTNSNKNRNELENDDKQELSKHKMNPSTQTTIYNQKYLIMNNTVDPPTNHDKHDDGDECESKRVKSPQEDFVNENEIDFIGDRDEELKKQPNTIVSQTNTFDNCVRPFTIRAVNIDRFITYFDKIWESVIQEISGN